MELVQIAFLMAGATLIFLWADIRVALGILCVVIGLLL